MGRDRLPFLLPRVSFDPSKGALTAATNLHIVSMAILAYDYLITLPAEYRLYKTASRRSLGFVLFILMRYLSIILIIVANVGFFGHHFSPNSCAQYFRIVPVFKALQMAVSHAILGIRAYNISYRNVRVGRTLILAFTVAVVLEWFSCLYDRIPLLTNGNCLSGSLHPNGSISAWSFYLAAMLYDFLALSISTYYLFMAKATTASLASEFMKILLYDGLGYFVVLTAINMTNIILFRDDSGSIQSIGASLGFAITSISSQRLLIHAREARVQQASVVASPLPTSNTFTSPLRSEGQATHETQTDGKLTGSSPGHSHNASTQSAYDVEVRVDMSLLKGANQPDREWIR